MDVREVPLNPVKNTEPEFSLIYPYYNNPKMLEMQVENWSRISGALARRIEIIVVDDCSSQPALPIMRACRVQSRLFRVLERIPWNMHQCRNIGAKEALGSNPWLFLSDMDIMLTPEMLLTMTEKRLQPIYHYTMERTFAPDFTVRKVHPNTLLVKRNTFWQVNGYDLDLTPVGGGGYGGDAQFMKQIAAIAPRVHLDDVVLIGYGRQQRDGEPALPDADTTDLDRAEWHEKYKEALARKRAAGDLRSINPIRTPYERVL
jgi:glycosyltransferase involved in cell wall biosynthesis